MVRLPILRVGEPYYVKRMLGYGISPILSLGAKVTKMPPYWSWFLLQMN